MHYKFDPLDYKVVNRPYKTAQARLQQLELKTAKSFFGVQNARLHPNFRQNVPKNSLQHQNWQTLQTRALNSTRFTSNSLSYIHEKGLRVNG